MPWTKVQTAGRFDIWSHSAIAANGNNNTDALDASSYNVITFQTVWADHDADTSTLTMQTTQDLTNWDNVTGAAITTSGTDSSNFAIVQPTLFRQIRFRVSETEATSTSTHTVFLIGRKDCP